MSVRARQSGAERLTVSLKERGGGQMGRRCVTPLGKSQVGLIRDNNLKGHIPIVLSSQLKKASIVNSYLWHKEGHTTSRILSF